MFCHACLKKRVGTTHKCAACEQQLPPEQFDDNILANAKKQNRLIVCKECEKKGYSARDSTTYLCRNGCRLGHNAYDRNALKHHKSRGNPLLCCHCMNTAKTRETTLLETLRAPDAWRCTCRAIKAGERAHAALHPTWLHKQTCALAPAAYGERRWDGKNKGITLADLAFLLERNSKW